MKCSFNNKAPPRFLFYKNNGKRREEETDLPTTIIYKLIKRYLPSGEEISSPAFSINRHTAINSKVHHCRFGVS